ncbi:MAG: hypothetical protein JJT89_06115 [Nitriliruptoraceae bacterium]|nr:hypothetical protein [Nitriliruptoraceae bacterium]
MRAYGDEATLRRLADRLTHGLQPVDLPGYPGRFFRASDGQLIGVRNSSRHGPTLDFDPPFVVNGERVGKIHVAR